eukprot:CAMPEP_0181293696 /NCGR_PEP_ID=MMETSP1101-20121128/3200_1 /TAXON_ID=46948 /ORGANISM="Rhodomonas abbreviata, Strain Caron Lab Isolate" /LENGTH=38 /DNA_ID= /DNA_START= /DNA_END= /DNA_ORIENTATION=
MTQIPSVLRVIPSLLNPETRTDALLRSAASVEESVGTR